MIVTAALVIVLSVFNGFAKLSVSLINTFNPDLVLAPKKGKSFKTNELDISRIKQIKGVKYITEVIEEDALMKYQDRQSRVTIMGVSEDYARMCGMDTMMVSGHFMLEDGNLNFVVLGAEIADNLGVNLNDYNTPITVFVARKDASFSNVFDNAINTATIFPAGVFSIQIDYDSKYAILPLRFAREILGYGNELTSLQIGLDKSQDQEIVQKEIQKTVGDRFRVKNRFQQEEVLYKIFRTEKWAVIMILAFILLIATFNIVGSLSMLILEKKKDIAVLQSLGASQALVRRIFLFEGMLISLSGAIAGLIIGAIICWVQIRFGLVRLGNANSTFVVNTYPVHMMPLDFMIIFMIVMVTGIFAAWYPVYNIRKIGVTMMRSE
jgi:ABC-type lipoprotein release transport system permease subunit